MFLKYALEGWNHHLDNMDTKEKIQSSKDTCPTTAARAFTGRASIHTRFDLTLLYYKALLNIYNTLPY